ncbi:ankyrin repeat domain-containing protein 27-like [Trichogramma pretiosum]|uniref:ankyrin repeat domain-containing protein 27-like n=1 Tax=Trichogramma pretiosum TaxID=7493 RepID=UPI0006C9E12B|nr:ankyrin repeat domain-containing protein 27-like [Trichogramma pretiosum]
MSRSGDDLVQVDHPKDSRIDETGLTHFHVACMSDREEIVKKFLELGQDPDLLVPETGDSPLHLALMYGRKTIAEMLLRNGANPTLAISKRLTPVDIVCRGNSFDADLVKTMFELACEKYLSVPTDEWTNKSKTLSQIIEKCHNDVLPGIIAETIEERVDLRFNERLRTELFHKAVLYGKEKAAELLLRRGVNPHLTDARGSTVLHDVCRAQYSRTSEENFVKLFLEICDDSGRAVDIDARDKRGNTPLYVAAQYRRDDLVKLLLRVGANPNLANVEGQTPLHFICDMFQDHLLVDIIFEIDDEKQRNKVQINSQDNEGNTPLLLSLRLGNKRVTEVLLGRGADPNIANAMGSTALHLISKDHCYGPGELAKLFFEICDDNRAEMSLFVFPTESYYGARSFDWKTRYPCSDEMEMASGALLTIEILENVGYQLSRDDATTIMKFFAKHEMFEKVAVDIEKPLYDDENLAARAKTIMVTSCLSFDDLIQLRPEEAEKLLTYVDYFELAHSEKFSHSLAKRYNRAFHALCEKLSKGFFRSWTLDPFWELIHQRLPLECCELILAKLNNKDLFNICLATIMLRHDKERENNC